MKAKSMKLRTLITLHALYKHTDKNHRMNSVKLNEFLAPYGLECSGAVISDTVRIMREFGIDVRNKGVFDNQGVWIADRPLNDDALNKIIFAVGTNPHITKEQALDILSALKPCVTVYQEPLLDDIITENSPSFSVSKDIFDIYKVVNEAIAKNRRIHYVKEDVLYDKDAQVLYCNEQWGTLFTPKCFYQTDNEIYLFGYNHPDGIIEAVNVKDIKRVYFALKHEDPNQEQTSLLLKDAIPQEYIAGETKEILYEGPVIFRCRGQYLADLLRRFGQTDEPIVKDSRCRADYSVKHAVITTNTLHWLVCVPEYGIRIKGPEALKKAITDYYEMNLDELFNPSLHMKKKHKLKKM